MLALQDIIIQNLRNIECSQITLNPHVNLFYGNNGSGKTSFLEAIYLLGYGRSFRSHLPRRLIREGEDALTVFARLKNHGIFHKLGIQKSLTHGSYLKLNGYEQSSVVSIIKLLPLQLINTDSFELFCGPSKIRRQFLDWGLFHVKHIFFGIWKEYERVLKQRNALLRQPALNKKEINVWDELLIALGLQLDSLRREYLQHLNVIFKRIVYQISDMNEVSVHYKQGWSAERTLSQALEESLLGDKEKGYTRYGPHRADLEIKLNRALVKDKLSRGQQKLLLLLLNFAQSNLLVNQGEIKPILLIDDFTAEFDAPRLSLVVEFIKQLKAQTFITLIDPASVEKLFLGSPLEMFHVKQGCITNVSRETMLD